MDRAGGMTEEGRKGFSKSLGATPKIQPESSHRSIANGNFGFSSERRQFGHNITPNRGDIRSIIPEIFSVIPAILLSKPINPGSRRSTLEFEEKFFQEAHIFLFQVRHSKTPLILGRQTSSQATLHCPPVHLFSPVQRKALCLATRESVVLLNKRREHIA